MNKMKKLILLFALLGATSLYAQDLQYQKIIDTKLSKADAYSASLQWFGETFNSGKSVIQTKDPESGIIVGNGRIEEPGLMPYYILFTITVETKDKRVRVTLNNLSSENAVSSMVWTTETQLKTMSPKLDEIIDSLTQALAKYNPNW